MKVYTKGGDKGKTSLIGGSRVSKCDSRVEAYGTVDELSAFVALLADRMRDNEKLSIYVEDLDRINSQLMTVEAHLAADESSVKTLPEISNSAVEYLENRIDEMQAKLEPITKFTIPGGHELVSLSHVCRTVCRRSERRSIAASAEYPICENVVVYLNRLSDYLYLIGRSLSAELGAKEILWIP
ncbi:MAG: cob(I)yrinic acid a,c-diamide adenosyltransferase [Rikenellaceae bacterium]